MIYLDKKNLQKNKKIFGSSTLFFVYLHPQIKN